jgi:hypothetical protein
MLKKIALSVLTPTLCVLALSGCGEPKAYDGGSSFQSTPATNTAPVSSSAASSSNMSSASASPVSSVDVKEAGKYWKRDGKKVDTVKTKRVLIAEFGVVFVTSRDSKIGNNSLSLGTMMRIAGVGRREYAFDSQFKADYPTQLYNQFVKQLESQGYEVIPVEQTLASKAMEGIEVGKAGAKKSGGYYHGFFGGDGSQKVEIYPAAGLDRMGAGFLGFGEVKNMKSVNAAMGELGADMAVRVLIGVGLHKGKATLEPGSSIRAFSNLKSSKMPNGSMNYWPDAYTTLTSKETLYYDTPVVDEKKFKAFKGNVWEVNEAEYAAAINHVFPSFATYGIVKLSQ